MASTGRRPTVITDCSPPSSGSYWFAPSVEALTAAPRGRRSAFSGLFRETVFMDTPRIPGIVPVFSDRADDDPDCPYVKVRSQRNADGSESHVWEKWVAFSVEPLYLALFARWDPGMIVRHHGHYSPHTLTVLAGSFTCGDVELGPGGHIELPFGASFGPFVAGADGVELYEVMMGDPRSWSDDEISMRRWLADRGVTQLPDPPIELPGGLEDLRAVFARAEELAAGADQQT